jgi:hypothetical protein
MIVAPAPRRACEIVPWIFAFYAAASLLHFTHNAEYLAQYPNLPASWTRATVYLTWCGLTAVGLMGFVLYRAGNRRIGLTAMAIYGGLGFAGLLHYTRAPVAHHSAAMNVTIWAEVAAATVFLVHVASVANCLKDNSRHADHAAY